uniref:Uncharacterized protein n=1 Tax=Anguilla anguilla TaxID=7936 RepID=A0A0E9XNW4_ANGAN
MITTREVNHPNRNESSFNLVELRRRSSRPQRVKSFQFLALKNSLV